MCCRDQGYQGLISSHRADSQQKAPIISTVWGWFSRVWLGKKLSFSFPQSSTKNPLWEGPGRVLAPTLTPQVYTYLFLHKGINIYWESGNLPKCLPYPLVLLLSFSSWYLWYSLARGSAFRKMKWRTHKLATWKNFRLMWKMQDWKCFRAWNWVTREICFGAFDLLLAYLQKTLDY